MYCLVHNYIKSLRINYNYFFYFFIYSFIGWCIETVYVSIYQGRFVFRGFLFGPLCPVYGFGALIILFVLEPLNGNLLMFFSGAVFLTSALEYLTGYFLKTAFNSVIWDYSTDLLNFQGRISLKCSIIWGFLSLFFIKILHPAINRLIRYIPENHKEMFSNLITLCFAVDIILTFLPYLLPDLEVRQIKELFSLITIKKSQDLP